MAKGKHLRFTPLDREKLRDVYDYFGPEAVDTQFGLSPHKGRIPRLWLSGGRNPTDKHIERIRRLWSRIPHNKFSMVLESHVFEFEDLFDIWLSAYQSVAHLSQKSLELAERMLRLARGRKLDSALIRARLLPEELPLGDDESIADRAQVVAWHMHSNRYWSLFQGVYLLWMVNQNKQTLDELVREVLSWRIGGKLWVKSPEIRSRLQRLIGQQA